ncbi:peptidase S41 [Streptomyces sp. A7024]|uniref:Tricorn protease homolog n=1 Tax=Streptomyces coryli TaxID=1128680 RepID=A0A6G4UBM7_9ACTN|nr:peptidase S41 [Streptomyces coryli]
MTHSATDLAYLRFPHLHKGLICFAAEDDLWVAPLAPDGAEPERAWRLTVDRTRVDHPRFSPDGSQIAFTSWRTMDCEIHLVDVEGGEARQLTYWGSQDAKVRGWTPPDEQGACKILATSSHDRPLANYPWAHGVPTDGAPGGRLPWGPVNDIAVADIDGERKTLLLTGKAPHEPAAWKRYRGGATGRLYLHGQRLLKDLGGHLDSVMFVNGRIAFLSDHEGTGNLYSCLHDGSDLRRHSDHADFYARHASTDGQRVIYQCAGDLWLAEDFSANGKPRKLDVRLGGPRAGRRPYQVAAASNVNALACDTTGRASAVVVRGALYWLTHRDGPARRISDTPGVRIRMPEMLGSTGQVAYITDAGGEDAIEIADLPRTGQVRDPLRLAAGQLGRVHALEVSPDGKKIAIASNDGRLLIVYVPDRDEPQVSAEMAAEFAEVAEEAAELGEDPAAVQEGLVELVRSVNGPVRDIAFSPDSEWITWAHPGIGRSLRQIKMAKLASRHIIDVTHGRFEDEQPCFTRDGRYLAFLSWRGFDPVYDVHTGDLSFPLGCRPYLVPLSSATLSPFALTPEGRPAAGGLESFGAADGEGIVHVEEEGIEARVTPFPVAASKYSSLKPVEGGGLVWLRWPISGALGETFANPNDTSGSPTLEHFDLAKAKHIQLTSLVTSFVVSGDGSRLVVNDGGNLRVIPANKGAEPDTTTYIDLRRIMHDADPVAEWRQAYDEAGRIIRAYFWEPGMCGIDWDAVLDQYRPLLDRVAAPDDFADLLREVLGELGTSHAYVTAARRNEGPPHYQRPMGHLGVNFARTTCGRWAVGRILPGESSDSRARSPLAGTGIPDGAILTHVDGREVDPVTGPAPLLAAAGSTSVELTFELAPDRPLRRVAVIPLVDDRPLRYQDWVALRRQVVRKLSDGRCGYLHIPDMVGSGWAQFNRDLRMETNREALIIDVRGNAGGHISELVLEKLTRSLMGWDLTRNAQPVPYTSVAPRGPLVAIADEGTSSDGDMITAAFKILGLGPVVGLRTWGGVVGMTGRHRLGDGTTITVPMNAAWFEEYGWDIENEGVDPDIDAERTPLDWAEGRPSELDIAVQTALDLLADQPAAVPPDYSDVPDRRRPELPPRAGAGEERDEGDTGPGLAEAA